MARLKSCPDTKHYRGESWKLARTSDFGFSEMYDPLTCRLANQDVEAFHDGLSVLDEATIKPSDEKTGPRVWKNRWMRQS
jgi:hypothetical protein